MLEKLPERGGRSAACKDQREIDAPAVVNTMKMKRKTRGRTD